MINRSVYSFFRGRGWQSSAELDLLLTPPEALRPVLFLFYTLETVFNMFCMGYHITGMETISWDGEGIQYLYLLTFHIFMVWTPFQSIAICTGDRPSVCLEIWKSLAGTFAFILVSLTTMWDAERQFHMFFDTSVEEIKGEYNALVPIHQFSYYMRGQSISSLTCGLLYMLHATIMIDVKLTSDLYNSGKSPGPMPIPLFVMGPVVHNKLSTYEWFQEFCGSYSRDMRA
ncbi:uncharacterized protein LOC128261445 [Drosophila gunungcola]|uniref:DUF7775 domain-containing protein n=1 Tax=Drosophila gunungcola TaxID=103775 RepID=A0A9Q0BU82_9MUSC|nr:uncharacterized protein LOC128261445 [Drosophila gunungcola]KAI8044897.1 hypothetical protein M5D96_001072 [Drosophila gunungcola]